MAFGDGGNPLAKQFEEFYNGYYFKAFSFVVKKVNNRHDAEDIVGDAFLYCYDHFDDYDNTRASLGTWLYIIVNTKLKKYFRDRKPTLELDEFNDLPDPDGPMIERAAEISEMREALADALTALPETQRKIVILRYFKEMSTSETAEAMKMSEGNVRTQLSRALTKIKQYFILTGFEKE